MEDKDIPKTLEDAINKLQEQQKPIVFDIHCNLCHEKVFVEYPIPYTCPHCGGKWLNQI